MTFPQAPFEPIVGDDEFTDRLHVFHRVVYRNVPFDFDDVMIPFFRPAAGCVAHDHCLLHHDHLWHLYVLSNELAHSELLVSAVRSGDWQSALRSPYTVGDVHAVGEQLTNLKPVGKVLDPPQGDLGVYANTNSFVYRVGDRWVNMFCSFGPRGQGLSVAWSNDLYTWRYDEGNPVWKPPSWAGGTNVCKGPSIVRNGNTYFVFYNLNLAEGTSTVSLITTQDFRNFADHGPVLKFPFQLRGTLGCESPCAFLRDGIWHLMVASGDYWWHTISNRPDRFMSVQGVRSASVGGVYDLGPFHVGKVIEYQGRWFMTSSYKAEHRRRSRVARKPIFRGEYEDEAGMLAGLFMTEIKWDGDFPGLGKPASLPHG